MLAWARWFWMSRYGYLLLALLLFDVSDVYLSVPCTVNGHVSTYASTLEDELHWYNLHRNLESFCTRSTFPIFNVDRETNRLVFLSDVSQFHDGNSLECERSYESVKNLVADLDDSSFKLLDGRSVSCSVGSLPDMLNTEDSDSFDIRLWREDNCRHKFVWTNSTWVRTGFHVFEHSTLRVPSPKVLLSPPFLHWELSHLFSPTFSFLTIINMHDQMLHVYEPFSTDSQFYAYGFEGKWLMPGDNATITVAFLPMFLGYASANFILQTSVGDFIIQCIGESVESPYRLQPITCGASTAKKDMKKRLSLYNPFDDDLHVVGITACFEATSVNGTHSVCATCQRVVGHDLNSCRCDDNDWMTVRSTPFGLPLLEIRASKFWRIAPRRAENIVELNLLLPAEVEVLGNIFVSLWNSSYDQIYKIVVPFEGEKVNQLFHSDCRVSSTTLLESLVGNDSERSNVFSLSMKNHVSYSLKVDEIKEITDGIIHFEIKYVKGFILTPGILTRVANLIYHPSVLYSEDDADGVQNSKSNCSLLILTNDTVSPQIEIPCQVVFNAFSQHKLKSTATSVDESSVILESGDSAPSSSGGTQFFGSVNPQLFMKDVGVAKAGEWFISNERPQTTQMGMSVLDELEILFPTTQVGAHSSKWIPVKNPNQKPATMHLMLNSTAVIDQCLGYGDVSDNVVGSSPYYELSTERDTFLVADGGVTELYLYPNESASFGPIVFRPSNCCVWRTFALIRNNLTGLELLTLRGTGGFASLVLFEGSKQIESMTFDFSLPLTLNTSPPEGFLDMKSNSGTCTRPLLKILCAKNAGDVPIEVKKIEVSGTGCGSDGFSVDPCGGFLLHPGESMRFLVSYQTDFSSPVVRRDLELVYSTGVLVIPMTATFPSYILSLCRKSFFWMMLRKVSLVILVAASATFLIFCRNIPQGSAPEGQEYLYKDEKRAISSITRICNQNHSHQTPRNFRVATMHPKESKFGNQVETHKSRDLKNLSSPQLDWVQDNRSNSTLPSYNEDHKKTQFPNFYTSMPKHTKGSSGLSGSPTMNNLTVRTGREKGRRKKKGGVLATKHDIASSQSGNSTPSSPLSPLTPFTSYQSDTSLGKTSLPNVQPPDVEVIEVAEFTLPETSATNSADIASEEFMFYGDKVLLSDPVPGSVASGKPFLNTSRKASIVRPVLLPSATFPGGRKLNARTVCSPSFLGSSPSSPCLSWSSAIAPHARAPGSRLGKERMDKADNENARFLTDEDYTYDIWGNHFPEFQLLDKPDSCSSKMVDVSPDSHSFFTETPQTRLQKSPL